MKFIVLIALFITTPAIAQIKVDDGIRSPKNMMVSGDSVIDDGPIEVVVTDGTGDEDLDMMDDDLKDANIIAPIAPSSPSAPAPKVKQVIKPISEMKIRRAITDDRIDDGYVQEMVKDNYMFTPDYKTNRELP